MNIKYAYNFPYSYPRLLFLTLYGKISFSRID